MFALIGWAIGGLIIGAMARLLMPGRQSMGLFLTMLLGVAGSILGGVLTQLLRGADHAYHPGGWIMSILGAVLLLWVFHSANTPDRSTR